MRFDLESGDGMADQRDLGALREAAGALRASQAEAARDALCDALGAADPDAALSVRLAALRVALDAAEPEAALSVRLAALLLECEEELDELEAGSDRVRELVDEAWELLVGAPLPQGPQRPTGRDRWELAARIVHRDGTWACAYCGTPLALDDWVLEHRRPLSRGGTNRINNLCLTCRDCNAAKCVRTVQELLQGG